MSAPREVDGMGELVPFPTAEPAPAEAVLDGELVDDAARPVDAPDDDVRTPVRVALTRKAAERAPILPSWLRSGDELRFVTRWLLAHVGHVCGFHAARVPVYAGRLAARAPAGAARVLTGAHRWVFDAEGRPLRAEAVRKNDPDQYLKLARIRAERVRARMIVAGVGLALLLAAVLLLAFLAAGWIAALVLAALVVVLGWIGAPADHPVVGVAVVAQRAQRLTSEQVARALRALGIGAMTAKDAELTFPAPISRDGPGWRADVDLPHGVTSGDVIERRDRLASGLRRPLGCCWPETAPDQHAGRLVLWVGDEDLATARQAAWPLLRTGTADLFGRVPFGTDQRGRPVGVDLMYSNVLIGAMPGAGKTFSLRVLLLGCALDPLAQLRVWELKGTGDLDALASVCHTFGSGPDDDTAAACLADLRELRGEIERRAKAIKALPRDLCPENKVTPELAAKPSLGLRPLVMAIDECQNLFSHEDYGTEAGKLATDIIKLGRALGVILLLATQRPDAKSLPQAICDNVGVRFCLRVMGQVANDMVLGTSSYKNGLRASTFTSRDLGIGYLVGAGPDARIVRSYYVDGLGADRVAGRARVAREQAGTLSGHAAGEHAEAPVYNVRDDVLAVARGETRLWSSVLLERLADLRPQVYGGWSAEQLAAALRPWVRPGQVWGTTSDGTGTNRQGYQLAELSRAERS